MDLGQFESVTKVNLFTGVDHAGLFPPPTPNLPPFLSPLLLNLTTY